MGNKIIWNGFVLIKKIDLLMWMIKSRPLGYMEQLVGLNFKGYVA